MLSERFVDALNEQIAREFAANQYVGIGAHYAAQTFPQLSAFFYEQAEEEREHAIKMVTYLLDRDANVHFGAIEEPRADFPDHVAHRTVDGMVQILETVSLSPRGVTLSELAVALGAAKSSVQELTNGLLARGYLVSDERRFHLGPGPFILASRANKLAAASLDHQSVADVAKALGCTVLVGVRVGDAIVFVDHGGEESPSLTFVARTQARRPLYTSAAGKTLLANVPDDEMNRLLDLAGPEQAAEVRQFLAELPEIRSRRLAFNRGATLADAFTVATPLLAPDGALVASITAGVGPADADRLDELGEELKKAVAALGPQILASDPD